ncbi:MAG: Gfo/Idh/MocA family oxidoreductase [Alphaproteobacteria bacterium]|nr:Gfo/Idh/MocA family oxidoreductase [Alphaproteobacteria bacterium]
MKQVVQNVRSGQVQLKEVPIPACGSGEVLVRVEASLISAGTEKMVMDFAGKSLLGKAKERPDLVKKVLQKVQRDGAAAALQSAFGKLDEPLPLGYSAAGTVMQVGANLTREFRVGDRVAIAGAGLANHAEYCAVPRNLAVKIPGQVPAAAACYATLAAIALHGVRNAEVTLGSRVLVVGLGLVGQLAVQLAAAAGARVAGVDPNPTRSQLAKHCGAQWAVGPKALAEGWQAFTEGRGFDAILLCAATASDELLQQAAELARDRATVVLVGKVGTRFDYASYMKKELNLKVSRSYGPGRYDPAYEQQGLSYPPGFVPFTERDNLADAVRLMHEGKLNPAALTTHTVPFTEALKAYDLIASGGGGSLGVVLAYPETAAPTAASIIAAPQAHPPKAHQLGISILGSGNFARSVLVPALAKNPNASLRGIISKGGLSAAHVREKFNAAWAGTQVSAALEDADTHAVLIATRHNAHAGQVVQALQAGKHVWVEKPLALNTVELGNIERALAKAPNSPLLMVGFNRRFSPALVPLQAKLAATGGPRRVVIRVNAGQVEANNWQQTDEGGGRLLGEVCHFTDLALWLLGQGGVNPVEKITANRGAGQDDYSITLRFADGSLADILYASEGDPAAPKERLEVFGGGAYGVMDNYTTTTWQQGGRVQTLYRRAFWQGQNKGHAAALAAWVAACRGQANRLPSVTELLTSSRLILQIQTTLTKG